MNPPKNQLMSQNHKQRPDRKKKRKAKKTASKNEIFVGGIPIDLPEGKLILNS
jgi:hypothetical protein